MPDRSTGRTERRDEITEDFSPAARYHSGVLGHGLPTEQRRLKLLEQLQDPETRRILDELIVDPSMRCLELGAGSGSIARWLAARCPTGEIVATDVNIQFIDQSGYTNLKVLRHDVVRDDFPPASFDLIHARALTVNLPERDSILPKIVRWLAPGGWLVIEDPALFPVDSSPYPAFHRILTAFEELMAESHGCDHRWPRHLPARLAESGLHDVSMSAAAQACGNGGLDDEFWKTFLAQLGPAFVESGKLTDQELADGLAMIDDPAFVDIPVAFISAWGRRAA